MRALIERGVVELVTGLRSSADVKVSCGRWRTRGGGAGGSGQRAGVAMWAACATTAGVVEYGWLGGHEWCLARKLPHGNGVSPLPSLPAYLPPCTWLRLHFLNNHECNSPCPRQRALLVHVRPLAEAFGRRGVTELLLPLLITCLNAPEGRLRAAFFKAVGDGGPGAWGPVAWRLEAGGGWRSDSGAGGAPETQPLKTTPKNNPSCL